MSATADLDDDGLFVDDTEPIAFGVGQHYVVGIRRSVVPRNLLGPKADQTLNLGLSIIGEKIDMNAGRNLYFRTQGVECYVWAVSVGREEMNELGAVVDSPFIPERLLPEPRLPLEVVYPNNDGSHSQHEPIL